MKQRGGGEKRFAGEFSIYETMLVIEM